MTTHQTNPELLNTVLQLLTEQGATGGLAEGIPWNGMTDGNWNWTLFIADVSGGDQSTLTSWTLEIAAVPEPASLIEGSIAVLFLGGVIGLYRLKGKKAQAQPQPC